MPRNDTCSEAEAWSIASSTIMDTYSEPPRCTGKFAEKIMNRAYGGMDPEESVVSDTSGVSGRKSRSSKSSVASRSVAPQSATSSRIGGSSSRKAHTNVSGASSKYSSVQQPSVKSAKSRRTPQSSAPSRPADDDSISGRSQLSALERRLESSRCGGRSAASRSKSKSTASRKSNRSRPDPNVDAGVALVRRKHAVDPPDAPSAASGSAEPVAVAVYHDAPSARGQQLSTCDESDEDASETYRDAVADSHDDSYYSEEESGSYSRSGGSRSSYSEESGTMIEEDASNSLLDMAEDALAIREDDITVPSMASGALVPRTNTKEHDALVAYEGRYLAAAVDNDHAMVPFDSTLFESYDHTFVKCPEHLRFLFLYTFLKKNADKKIMIFFSTTNSAKFHARLLDHFHVPCLVMHSKQKREKFINTFFRFSDLEEGILCATDAAGRDLDIPPSVDWVVQFEPPDDPTEFILRVARISCDSDRVGRSLLFLNPGEQGFLKYYHSAAIPVSEFEIPKLAEIQTQIEYHVNESEKFVRMAREAYGSYLIAYASHTFRDVYNVHDLNKNDVAAAFGLVSLPSIGDDSDDDEESSLGNEYQSTGEAPKESGRSRTWTSNKKPKEKTWMKGEKIWPHCQIKVHPKFRDNYIPKEEDEYSG